MKVTKPPRETVSSLNYRDADDTPTTTAPELKSLSSAALSLLARDAGAAMSTEDTGKNAWTVIAAVPDRPELTVRCTGPDLPSVIPNNMAHPSVIPFERPWIGTYRLIVRAPLVVLDLYWRAEEPLRIMGFSRGDWEADLEALAPGR